MLAALLAAHSFYFEDRKFMLDGEEILILAGEMHPSRIPHQYWEHRILMSKAMGLNTISIYIFWNAHEREDGSFDFASQQNNMSHFIELCRRNDMYVIVRPGPYVCGEWDFGGIPAYALKNPDSKVRRSTDEVFVKSYRRYLTALAANIGGQMIADDGPILMIQIENEYGFWYYHDKDYLNDIRQVWLDNGVAGPFFNADPAYVLSNDVRVDGAAIGLNGNAGDGDFETAFKLDPTVPAFVTEIYPGWFRHWGEGNDWSPTDVVNSIADYLKKGRSFIFYVVHGATSFGLTSGSNWINGLFTQDLTSYDYGSPISECGKKSYNYDRYREVLQTAHTEALIDIPEPIPTMQVPNIKFERVASVWDQPFTTEAATEDPMYFEYFDQNQGLGIYSAQLPVGESGQLKFTHLNDYVQIYLNGRLIENFTRIHSNNFVFQLPVVEAPGKLEIFVEAMGHINWDNQLETDRKGIYGPVTFNGKDVKNWTLRRLPLQNFTDVVAEKDTESARMGGVFKAVVDLKEAKDIYIDFTNYYKGYIYVNGHNLGRYWGIGPQYRLFCPGVWLSEGENTIYFLEFEHQEAATATAFELYKGCPEGQVFKGGYCQ